MNKLRQTAALQRNCIIHVRFCNGEATLTPAVKVYTGHPTARTNAVLHKTTPLVTTLAQLRQTQFALPTECIYVLCVDVAETATSSLYSVNSRFCKRIRKISKTVY